MKYTVIFKREEEPERWMIQKHDVSLEEAIELRDGLLSCGNIVTTEILCIKKILKD